MSGLTVAGVASMLILAWSWYQALVNTSVLVSQHSTSGVAETSCLGLQGCFLLRLIKVSKTF
jgi:hypothetical protein